jgi:hypothetical protein
MLNKIAIVITVFHTFTTKRYWRNNICWSYVEIVFQCTHLLISPVIIIFNLRTLLQSKIICLPLSYFAFEHFCTSQNDAVHYVLFIVRLPPFLGGCQSSFSFTLKKNLKNKKYFLLFQQLPRWPSTTRPSSGLSPTWGTFSSR